MRKLKAGYWLLWLAGILAGGSLYGAGSEIVIKASAPKVVSVGQQFRLVYEINTKEGKFKAPDLKGFEILMGPSTSYSQSIQIVNGKMTKNIRYTYTYILQAMKEGDYEIPPAQLVLRGRVIESGPVRITVVKGSQPATTTQGKSHTSAAAPAGGSQKSSSLYVRMIVDKTKIYQGEPVAVTVKIFSRVSLTGFEEVDMPEFDGFLKQEIPTPNLTSLQREYIDGVPYNTGVIQRYLLFPQTTGDIKIDPVKIVCLVRKRMHASPGGFFDDFFDSYQTVRQTIFSNPLTIHVSPLPAGAPEDFAGAVGTFGLDASLDKESLKVNDAVTLKVRISGNGNLKLIQPPKIDFPPDFESYDPKVVSRIKNTVHGATGYKQFEYLMIPRHAGKYRIPPVVFSYFDPAEGSYKTLRTPAFTVEVQKGEEGAGTSVITGGNKEELRFLGKDIRYIYTRPVRLKRAGYTLFDTWFFRLFYPVLFLLFVLFVTVYRRHRRVMGDQQRVRNRKANKVARKRLKVAGQHLKQGDRAGFYEEVLKAVWGYLSDKMLLPLSDLTRDTAARALGERGVSKDLIERLIRVIDQCEYARYAPEGASGGMDKLYEETVEIISELEQKL